MQAIEPDQVEGYEDPVAALASQCIEVLMDHEGFVAACNRIVFRSMGLHPNTMIGGNQTDREEFYRKWMLDQDMTVIDLVEMSPQAKQKLIPDYLTEDDPRYQLYWELLAQLNSQIFAQMIASQKFRWTPSFAQRHTAQNSPVTPMNPNGANA